MPNARLVPSRSVLEPRVHPRRLTADIGAFLETLR